MLENSATLFPGYRQEIIDLKAEVEKLKTEASTLLAEKLDASSTITTRDATIEAVNKQLAELTSELEVALEEVATLKEKTFATSAVEGKPTSPKKSNLIGKIKILVKQNFFSKNRKYCQN